MAMNVVSNDYCSLREYRNIREINQAAQEKH